MTAEILAVGTELLLGDIVNTNAQFLSRELAQLGVNVYSHTVVGDNPARLKTAYANAFEKADLVIATGGLGPTADDITKEVAAEYFNLPLELHEESWTAIQEHFKSWAASSAEPDARQYMPANNRKQAMLPKGCTVLANGNGTAPGVLIEQGGKILIMLPGPPNEMEPMFIAQAVPFLRKKTDRVFLSRTLKVTGVGESRAEEMLRDLIDAQTNPTIAPYAKLSEVWLRLTASAESESAAGGLIAPAVREIYKRLGKHIYGEDEDTLEGTVVRLLKEKKLLLACAESCTGGLLTAALVNVSGVSDVLVNGLVTYSNQSKMERLGVSGSLLETYGAVSPQVAGAMARGAAVTSGASVGVSTTGIAGPEGGTAGKPVGLIYVGLHVNGEDLPPKELRLRGSRQKIRQRAVVSALDYLRLALQ